MPAGRCTRHADVIRVDAILTGVKPDEAHGPVHVLNDLGNRVARLAAVNHREDRITSIGERLDKNRRDVVMRGNEPSTDHHDHANPLGVFFGREDVHCQGRSEFPSVDHIFAAVERGFGGPSDGRKSGQVEGQATQGQHQNPSTIHHDSSRNQSTRLQTLLGLSA